MTDQDTIDKAAQIIAAHSTTAPPPHEHTEVCCGECGEAISWRGLTAEQTYERSRHHLAQKLADAGLLADSTEGYVREGVRLMKERDAAVAKLDRVRKLADEHRLSAFISAPLYRILDDKEAQS